MLAVQTSQTPNARVRSVRRFDTDGTCRDIGISDIPVLALRGLTIQQRMKCSLLKMHNACFKGNGGEGYIHYNGGGVLTPQAYSGFMGMAVRNGQVNVATLKSTKRVVAAVEQLKLTHPEVAKMLTVMDRAADPTEHLSADAGGAAAMPSIAASDVDGVECEAREHVGPSRAKETERSIAPPFFGGVVLSLERLDAAAGKIAPALTTVGTTLSRGPHPVLR